MLLRVRPVGQVLLVPARRFSSKQHADAKILPFRLSKEEATKRFHEWAASQYLAPSKVYSLDNMDHVYGIWLPFYAFEASASTDVVADVGDKRVTYRGLRSQYSSSLPEMQVFASYNFKTLNVQVCKNPMTEAVPLRSMASWQYANKDLDVFQMQIQSARTRVLDRVQGREKQRVSGMLQDRHPFESVSNISLSVNATFTMTPVYFPAYVFQYRRFGTQFRCFVNGYDGRIEGQQHYSAFRVFLPLLAFGSVVAPPTHPITWITGVLIPSAVVSLATFLNPFFTQWTREFNRRRDQTLHAQSAFTKEQFDEDNAHFKEQSQWKSSQRSNYSKSYQQSSGSTQQSRKSRKLYQLLELKETASLEEIKASFRRLSFQLHPDINTASNASEKYREVLKAYQTLRDPAKRREYDASSEP